MCGIWALLGSDEVSPFEQAQFMRIMGRGPDLHVLKEVHPRVHLGFHRLAIVIPGDTPSEQPIVGQGKSVVCNGELYNHLQIKEGSSLELTNNGSDCAAIIHAFHKNGNDLKKTCAMLDGVFAFIMADEQNVYVGRDPLGVRPLFYGYTSQGNLAIGSEVKSISELCERVEVFPPGCCATIAFTNGHPRPFKTERYYFVPQIADRFVSIENAQLLIREVLTKSVEKRLMGNRHFGFMLSGGLDSSLIAAIATRALKHKPVAFSVGFEDSEDLVNARRVAQYLNINHVVHVITAEDCLNVIPEVIYALETYEPAIVRCGIAHYLLCRHIASISDVKVLLSGEGADELFGSYAYMQKAPNAFHLHKEIHRRLQMLHQYDVLRCDRATSCHGLEIRVPFLDKKFIDLVARLPPAYKLQPMKLEKHMLRAAFEGWLPEEVLWRSKEGFGEALGKQDLGEIIGARCAETISDKLFSTRHTLYPERTPETKEEFWYRELFEKAYGTEKMGHLIHTKVYRTAAWQLTEEKENHRVVMEEGRLERLGVANKGSEEVLRLRRRSTGSTTLSGVA
ncbi:unnamed protein product, partial [Mesorhabditis belari]|uniref:Asparagine synthetase [glutamine-hydrolyzing] n=1 Tax=Mesorhabditis belari TaxID=2138241 RepID=A0AAF3J3F1_9BILA